MLKIFFLYNFKDEFFFVNLRFFFFIILKMNYFLVLFQYFIKKYFDKNYGNVPFLKI